MKTGPPEEARVLQAGEKRNLTGRAALRLGRPA